MGTIKVQQGFTLLELLITITIVGILAAIAVPQLGEIIVRERLRGAAVNVKQELTYARSEAIKRNQDVYAVSQVEADGSWCIGISVNADCDCTETDTDDSDACVLPVNGIQRLRRIESAEYDSVSLLSGDSISFDPVRGTASNGTYEFEADGNQIKVITSILGRVRVEVQE